MHRFVFCTVTLALLGATAGCTVGPEAKRPESIAGGAGSFVGPQARTTPEVARWWTTFDDGTTNALVERALAHNNDLRAAGASVIEAQALLAVAQGRRLPQVSANFSRSRTQNSFSLPAGRVQTLDSTYDLGGVVTWQADLFGRLRRLQQGALADLNATAANRQAVEHTVIAQTVRARAQVATLTRLLSIARDNTASFVEVEQLIEHRYDRGVATAVELRLARENLMANKAREPQLEYQLRAAQLALDVLVGRQPGTGEDPGDTLDPLPPLAQPAVGLPAALLDRRPDLRAAEFRHFAEIAGEGAAVADLLPDISISASGGWRSDRPRDLVDGDTLVWSLLSELAWKVWAGGSLRAQVDASRARVERTAAEYAQQVLIAMQEVEEALVREETARRAHDLRVQQVVEARQAERLARQRYERGVENLLTVLETEQRRREAENAQVLEQQTLWNARVDLHLALGGDWTPDEPADARAQE